MTRYIACDFEWPLQIPCRFAVRDTFTGEYALFPDHRGALHPNMRTMEAAEKRAARLNRAYQKHQDALAAMGGGNRWGECRRFTGRAAGLRIQRVERTRATWLRMACPEEKVAA